MRVLILSVIILLLTACRDIAPICTAQDTSSTQLSIVAAWDATRAGDPELAALWDGMPANISVSWLKSTTIGSMYNGVDFSADIGEFMVAWYGEIPDAIWIPDPDDLDDLDSITVPSAWGIQ